MIGLQTVLLFPVVIKVNIFCTSNKAIDCKVS